MFHGIINYHVFFKILQNCFNVTFATWSNSEQYDTLLGVDGSVTPRTVTYYSEKAKGGYRIGEFVERAYAKKPSMQNKFDKEIMKVDERINVFYMVYSGMFLTVFPIPEHPNSKWVTSEEADQNFTGEEALFVKGILSM